MTRPADLPGFGTVDGDFVQTESKLIVPKSVTKDSSIEELETPDQLEERADIGAEINLVPDTVITSDEELFIKPSAVELLERHPDWEPNIEFQIQMFNRMIELCDSELSANAMRMDSIEILLEHYPLLATTGDVNEMRRLVLRNIEVEAEKYHYMASVQVRREELIPKSKGFWKRLFTERTTHPGPM